MTTMTELDLCKSLDKEKELSPNQNNSKVKAYFEQLKKLSTKSESELQKMGFNNQRITALKSINSMASNANSTDLSTLNLSSVASAASATVSLYLTLDGYYYDLPYEPGGKTFKTQVYVTTGWI